MASLSEIYPIDFVRESDIDLGHVDAAIFFPEAWDVSEGAFERGVSSFRFAGLSRRITLAPTANIVFSNNAVLHPAIRNARIPVGREANASDLSSSERDAALAQHGSSTLWQFRTDGRTELHTSGFAPPELQGKQLLLWSCLRPDDWVSLFPLMQFLRRLAEKSDWSPATTQACFMFDDPNLHSIHYGHLNFSRMARECLTHNYHVAIATVPLDAWYADAAAVDVFSTNNGLLSLLIHGNDHAVDELGRECSSSEALQVLAQAVKRVNRFESRTGLSVGNVMAPPHGVCSEAMVIQMLRLPLEGICTSVGSLVRLYEGDLPLGFGLSPASLLAGGFPMLRRWDFRYGLAPLRFAAFLGQPIISYGHQQDCANGLEHLTEIADAVNSWGYTKWTDPQSILRGLYRIRRDDELLHVQMWSKRVRLEVPDGVSHIMVYVPSRTEACQVQKATKSWCTVDTEDCTTGAPVQVAPSTKLDLRISSPCSVDPTEVSPPPYRVWPVLRRSLAIGRDRMTPIFRAVGTPKAARLSEKCTTAAGFETDAHRQ